jgi:hypothetical protein
MLINQRCEHRALLSLFFWQTRTKASSIVILQNKLMDQIRTGILFADAQRAMRTPKSKMAATTV